MENIAKNSEMTVIEKLFNNLDKIKGNLSLAHNRLNKLSEKAGVRQYETEKKTDEIKEIGNNHLQITSELIKDIEKNVLDILDRVYELEQLISFETAKLAKEKGFNIPTRGFIEPKYHDTLEFIDDTCLYVYDGYSPIKEHHQILEEGWYLAPTQSLLQRWLREVHNINVESNYLPNIQKYGCLYIPMTGKAKRSDIKFVHKFYYDTYEEALEIGLYQALLFVKKS